MRDSSSKQPTAYLIRHAKSAYNEAEDNIKKKYENFEEKKLRSMPEYYSMKYDTDFEDCDIIKSAQTSEQIQKCRQKMHNIDLDLIIVSPLKRTMETCAQIFQGHHSKAPIIVDPIFREVLSSRCDIGSRLRESMKEFPTFDFSLIEDPDCWYVGTMQNEQLKNKIIEKLASVDSSQRGKVAFQMTLDYIKDLGQKRKSHPELILEAYSPVELQKGRLADLMKEYMSIAVVTHNYNIEKYIGVKAGNCSIYEYKQQYLTQPIQKIPKVFLRE